MVTALWAERDGACAGAFMQEPGKGQLIVTSTFDRSDRFFDAAGRLQPLAQYRKFEMTTYVEYGAMDWLTIILAPSSSQSAGSIGAIETADRYGRLEAGARIRLWRDENAIVSWQASVRAPYAFDVGLPPGLRKEVVEYDVRGLYGYAFRLLERDGFFGAELAYRTRLGAPDEWRADLTLGYRFLPQFLVLAQSFNVVSSAGAAFPRRRWHKAQVSGVYDLGARWSLQAGVYLTFAGVNMRREQGVIGGVWRAF